MWRSVTSKHDRCLLKYNPRFTLTTREDIPSSFFGTTETFRTENVHGSASSRGRTATKELKECRSRFRRIQDHSVADGGADSASYSGSSSGRRLKFVRISLISGELDENSELNAGRRRMNGCWIPCVEKSRVIKL